MLFSSIPGLQNTKERLSNSIRKHKVAHALLFSGNPGGAALPMALAYASYLICENKEQGDQACGKCSACHKMEKFVHPDVHFVFPVCGTKNFTGADVVSKNFLNQWRAFLIKNPYADLEDWVNFFGGENKQAQIYRQESREIISALSLKPFEAEFKVMIIWLPELMNVSAANSLLKILEEPSGQTVFIFVSQQEGHLLSTILSRVQIVKISSFNDEEIISQLNKEFNIDKNKGRQVAIMSDGNLNTARKLAQDHENDHHRFFSDWMRLCFKKSYSELVNWAEEFFRKSKTEQKQILRYSLMMLRESLVVEHQHEEIMRVTNNELKFVEDFGRLLKIDQITLLAEEFDKAHYHLERNANAKILFLDLSITIANTIN